MVDNQLLSLLWELRCILNPKAGGSLDCYLVCDGIKKKTTCHQSRANMRHLSLEHVSPLEDRMFAF